MTRTILGLTAACLSMLPTVVSVATASPLPGSATTGPGTPGALFVPAAFGDGPKTGAHHRRSHGEASKSVDPSHADLHGATREDADKAYRKQYGF